MASTPRRPRIVRGNRTQKPKTEKQRLAELALGRLLRLGSRPFQEGDIEEYERCRAIVLEASKEP